MGLVAAIPGQGFERRIDVFDDTVAVGDHDRVRRLFDRTR